MTRNNTTQSLAHRPLLGGPTVPPRHMLPRHRLSPLESLLVSALRRIIRRGQLEVTFASGATAVLGDGSGPVLRLSIGPRASLIGLLGSPSLTFGDAIVDEDIRVEQGSLYDVLDLLTSNFGTQPTAFMPVPEVVRSLANRLHLKNSLGRSRRNASYHYDIDRRLYRLFLDSDLQYSCAYFAAPGVTLEEAQWAKKRHIAAKLFLRPGLSVLDIGCGWGGLALYLASQCDVSVTGITLSREQLQVASERVVEQAPKTAVEFRYEDYRETAGRFDRIVSVGMFEHVGRSDYALFFKKCACLLESDGLMLLHTIGRSEGPSATDPWIARHIFPGGYIPALSELLPAIERAGLTVTDVEILRLHYADTLRAWRQRFNQHRTEAEALYDARFCRMWDYYLAACEAAFRNSGLVVFQIQLAKNQTAVPLTRDYIGHAEQALRDSEVARQSPSSGFSGRMSR